jgi:beta-aspartyl-peptidase (threonine type)
MIVVASANGRVGMQAALAASCALDAVEAGCRAAEDDPADTTVGYGGWPNFAGVVELDASIMDGTGRRVGAVAGLRRTRRAITVARLVMEELPHVLLVGDGADAFAAEVGFDAEDLLTPEAEAVWRRRVAGLSSAPLRQAVAIATDPERVAGTVNFLALDDAGRMASGVSTSGWAWKYPGRVGDSPVIGAGNYCDDRWGAAACTGAGELAIRGTTARTVVAGMQAGLSPGEACAAALEEAVALDDVPPSWMVLHVVALSPTGEHGAASTHADRTYLADNQELPRPQITRPR